MKFVICSALAIALAAPAITQTTSGHGASDTRTGAATSHDTHDKGSKSTTGKTSKSSRLAKPSTETTTVSEETTTTTTTRSDGPSAAAAGAASPAVPATPAEPADPASGTSAVPATPASPATPSAEAAKPNDPAGILRTEFPVYDKDASGALSKDEFSTWLLALKKAASQQTPMTDAQQTEWLATAFTDADADKSATISLSELTTYLTRGAKG